MRHQPSAWIKLIVKSRLSESSPLPTPGRSAVPLRSLVDAGLASEHAPAEAVRRAEVGAQPVIAVVVLRSRFLFLVAVEGEDLVVERERIGGDRKPVVEPTTDVGVVVAVLRLAEGRVDEVEEHVHVPASCGEGPVAGAFREAAVEHGSCSHHRRNRLPLEPARRQARRDVDHPAAAVAERDRKAARVDADVADDSGIDAAEDAEEILQVVGVVQAQVVESEQASPRACRPAGARGSRSPGSRPRGGAPRRAPDPRRCRASTRARRHRGRWAAAEISPK